MTKQIKNQIEFKFRNINGVYIEDTHEYVLNQINLFGKDLKIYIGTDSKVYSNEITFVSVICFHYKNKGVHFIFHKEIFRGVKMDIINRLWNEIIYSHNLADYLKEKIQDISKMIVIDLDLNPNKLYKSNQIHSAGVNFIRSCGYKVRTKSDEFYPAISAADHLC